jgi:tellurite resistance protein
MSSVRSPLKHLAPGWFAVVMGLAGLSLAWHAAVPVLGDSAGAGALVIGAAAALVFAALVAASLWRLRRHPEAWADDLRHPVRHVFVAAVPIALLLLVTVAVSAGFEGRVLETLWWTASLLQLSITAWVMSRWWRAGAGGGLPWASLTPALFIPIVGNVLVPLAGVPLGQPEWSAAQYGVGVLFWPVVQVLLLVRLANQGLWPERLLPANFIFIAPPAAIGLSALRFGVTPLVVWGLWGAALFALLWTAPLLRRIAEQPFGMAHWGMSFPMAAFTALALRLAPEGPMSLLGIALLACTSLLVAALVLATIRGLRDGSLLVPETVPISAGSGIAPA